MLGEKAIDASANTTKMVNGALLVDVTDFFLAVFLMAKGFVLAKVTLTADDGEIFVFDDHPELADTMQAYHDDSALVSPKRFGDNIMRLRAEIRKVRGKS